MWRISPHHHEVCDPNLLTSQDSSFMIGDEVRWFHYHALVATSAYGFLPLLRSLVKWLILSLLDCHF